VRRVLVDTGPLVAILSRDDLHHASCVATLRTLPGPMFSCWPVITEAAWLLRRYPRVVWQLLENISGGLLEVLPLTSLEAKAIAGVMKRYANIRPQLADATLLYLAERDSINTIFTLDQRDFLVYRTGRKRVLQILPEL